VKIRQNVKLAIRVHTHMINSKEPNHFTTESHQITIINEKRKKFRTFQTPENTFG
jgi:hypothetical protein